ncbi:glutamate synthase large subunit [Haladaptatus sp. DFWS20]|uniref:glutamate synthase large subunit n=1 Tax=Haladaptatus sp. DFWS20 TaxID=3403467 RepID=UPI003EBD2D95
MTTHLADPTDQRSNCGVGVVMNLDADATADHKTVTDGLSLLTNLEHRGTTGAEPNTGDGAGILVQRPDDFFAAELDCELPETYAVGQLFLPRDDNARRALQRRVETGLESEGLSVFHWRAVPTDNADLGKTALDSEPAVVQCFVEPSANQSVETFDTTLYVARRVLEREIGSPETEDGNRFYVCSLDRKTLVYKGLLTGEQLSDYYLDLAADRFKSSVAMVHARFSTNTLGAWHLAHPYRRTIHNGEINTIQGNVNWMTARETDLESERLGDDISRIMPVTRSDQSDTASLDNVLELLLQDGRSLPHALRMLVPEAWRSRTDDDRQAWYDFHASLVEPWDGPALVAATDGERVGAVLDRNGLRPCRYDVTEDDRLVMASEVGALDIPDDEIVERGRLQPGQLFLADAEAGGVVSDEDVFEELTDRKYAEWVEREQLRLPGPDTSEPGSSVRASNTTPPLRARQAVWGYTDDELTELIEPMARQGKDPVGSMGDDTPLSVLSDFDRPLFSYFKQLFAQVTNPPIDYIREELVTSLETRLGRQRNLLGESPAHARQLVLDSPVLTDSELSAVTETDLTTEVVDITFDPDIGLEVAIERVRAEARDAVEADVEIVILSDRQTGDDRVPIPSLLATGAVHHHLVREGMRTRTELVVESGDPRTVHHLATLVGYGAGAVNPYLAYETIADLVAGPEGAEKSEAIDAYVSALETGLLKTMAKMGISTVESYRGAQIFEAVGLNGDVVDEYFTGTENRTEGIGLDEIEADVLARHETAFDGGDDPKLARQGEYEHRSNGIHHQWNPKTVGALQRAVRQGDEGEYQTFASEINDQNERLQTLRGLLEFDIDGREPIPIEEVEPVEDIVQRFSTAAMSLGSLSPEAHENNAIAMSRIGGKSNTGEGGEPPERFDTERECSIKQVASGRFGVTSRYLQSADELQIKMAQGSKPGEGGHLPGGKVNEAIAHVRHATPGVGLISPPPQHDIYSIEDLKQLIHDLKTASDGSDINVKLVSEAGIGTIAAGVAKANADVVHISGHSGGTGASPRTSIKNAGLPWELGLAEANQMLRQTGLRSRIKVTVDGGMKTGRDVAVAALLGAEEFSFGTASLVTSGCVMARQCHNNTCPVGIATQDEDLRKRFPGEPDHVINYMTFIATELREIMAELGIRTVEEMVGRVELLQQRETTHSKACRLDLSAVLADPVDGGKGDDNRTKTREQDHDTDDHLDHVLLTAAQSAIEDGESVEIEGTISNQDRTVGAMLSSRISAVYGESGLPDGTISCRFEGTAGQSFGAFCQSGVDLFLSGTANDYVGKGLSGGRIAVQIPNDSGYDAENVVVGNVALYGATEGEAYINGVAGERFGVRNSGAKAVVEGVGDHGCEYMTGGVVAVLGDVGENFAAGMSGGVAYVLNDDGAFAEKTNTDMVSLETDLSPRDERVLRRLVENHATYTGSERAEKLLAEWEEALVQFVKVMPEAYERAVAEEGREDVRNSPPPKARVDENASAVRSGAD